MRNALQNRLDEIRSRLRKQLQELDVEPHAKRQSGGYLVTFKGEGVFSPLTITLHGPALLPEPLSTWHGCNVHIQGWEPITFGSNGWTYFNNVGQSLSFTLRGDIDKIFDTLSKALATAGSVREASVEGKVTENESVAMACEEIEKGLSLYGDIKVSCSSRDGVETLEFVDPADRTWTFAFKRERVTATIDGKKAGSFEETDLLGLRNLILDKLEYSRTSKPKR